MRSPLFTLPVEQNWDCQATGNCCREYRINVTDDERRRIEEQGWDRDRGCAETHEPGDRSAGNRISVLSPP